MTPIGVLYETLVFHDQPSWVPDWTDGYDLRLYDPETGRWLPTPEEWAWDVAKKAQEIGATAMGLLDSAKEQLATARGEAESAKKRASAAEVRAGRLAEELERLRSNLGNRGH